MTKSLCILFLLVFICNVKGSENYRVNSLPDLYNDENSSEDEFSNNEPDFPTTQPSTEPPNDLLRRVPIECFADPHKGPCNEKILRWNYISRNDKCIKFWYGGCGGNGNNFYSKAECEAVCKNTRRKVSEPEDLALMYCSQDGIKPHFYDCKKYIECLNQIGYIHKCPPGLHFNKDSKKCVIPCAAFCDQTYGCICKWRKCADEMLKCPVPHGHFPYPGNCSKYISCTKSVPTLLECQKGEKFDVSSRVCTAEDQAVCFRILQARSKEIVTGRKSELNCPEPNGNFSYPDDCTKYQECQNSVPKLQECPEAQSFDSEKKICVPWYEAKCPRTTYANLNFPEIFNCPERNGNYSVPLDCTKYIECKDSVSTPTECPRGQFFDSKKKICVRWYEAFCYHAKLKDSDLRQFRCKGNAVFPYPPDCTKYFICQNSNLNIGYCPDGHKLDSFKLRCVPEKEARCA